MIEFLLSLIFSALIGFSLSYFIWWGMMIGAFVIGFVYQMNGFKCLFSGGFAGALTFGLHIYIIDHQNASRLSKMMEELLKFDPFVSTIFLGFFLGALGMLSGKYLRDLFGVKKKDKFQRKLK